MDDLGGDVADLRFWSWDRFARYVTLIRVAAQLRHDDALGLVDHSGDCNACCSCCASSEVLLYSAAFAWATAA
jgi:hypothetical protein